MQFIETPLYGERGDGWKYKYIRNPFFPQKKFILYGDKKLYLSASQLTPTEPSILCFSCYLHFTTCPFVFFQVSSK